MSPVSLSVTVPAALSTKRRVVVVVLVVVLVVVVLLVGVVLLVVVDVLVLVVVVGVAHSPAVQAPLQHWLFAVQVARFGLQLALLGVAPALRGVPTRSARAANIAAKPPRARCDMCCTSRGTGATGEAVVVPPPSCAQEPRTIGGWASRSREGSVGVADALRLNQAAPAACRHLEQGVSLSGSAAPAAAAARPAGAIAVPPAAYHHAQPPRSLGACSTAAPGLRSCACAAVRCSCWWSASATPRRRRWPGICASAIPSCVSVRPLGSAKCSTTTASRRPAGSRALGEVFRAPAHPRSTPLGAAYRSRRRVEQVPARQACSASCGRSPSG